MFIHGLWLLPSSWDNWADLFEEAGYAAVTPSWPDDPETVEEAQGEPRGLREEDARAGRRSHRRGDRGAGQEAGGHGPLDRRTAGPDDRRPRVCPRRRWRSIPGRSAVCCRCRSQRCRSASPVLRNPSNRGRAITLTLDQFKYGWANALERRGGEAALRDLPRGGAGRGADADGQRQPEPVDRGKAGPQEPRPRAAADHRRREGPHGAVGDRKRSLTSARDTTRR